MSFFDDLGKYARNTALITEPSRQISYKFLCDSADRLGEKIKKRCLVFAVCGNNFDSLSGYLGLLRIGAVPALIHDTMDNTLLMNLINAYKPEFIYLPTEKVPLVMNSTTVETFNRYSLLKTNHLIDYAIYEDLALLLTTSGSTGSPKFVRQSYKNINSNAESIAQYLEIQSTDRPISTMPMSYTYMLSIINSHLLKGASLILTEATIMDKLFWATFKQYEVTTFGGVPFIYEMLKKLRFRHMDLPRLHYITQAGGKLSQELAAEFADICEQKGIKFYVMYGQTEATARMSYLPWQYARSRAGSMGIAIPGGQFWLEDGNGNIINESDTSGELVYKGDNVTLGYAESCHDLYKGDENKGILHTGDLAKRDMDGFYYITGRKKRFLKMFGKRVNLDEVEEIIRAQGYDCACAGADDHMKIYITKLEKNDKLKKFIAGRTGINQAGFCIVKVDKIPRNESGKVLYSILE